MLSLYYCCLNENKSGLFKIDGLLMGKEFRRVIVMYLLDFETGF